MPAARFRRGERVPVVGSAKLALMISKKRKRTASLAIEPCAGVQRGFNWSIGWNRKARVDMTTRIRGWAKKNVATYHYKRRTAFV